MEINYSKNRWAYFCYNLSMHAIMLPNNCQKTVFKVAQINESD
uniref:Uncharacterized protein n=1 Tax=Anguilla anguilla TaxID=7936 RepID=A0A0E9XUN2_ANGAN